MEAYSRARWKEGADESRDRTCVVVASRFNITDDEDFVTVTEAATGRYLSIAICDANNDISSDHGYIGDPFLTLIPYVPPEPPGGTRIMLQ